MVSKLSFIAVVAIALASVVSTNNANADGYKVFDRTLYCINHKSEAGTISIKGDKAIVIDHEDDITELNVERTGEKSLLLTYSWLGLKVFKVDNATSDPVLVHDLRHSDTEPSITCYPINDAGF